MKIKLCVSVLSAFLIAWLLVCGPSAFAQQQDLSVPGNVNLEYAPDHPGPYAYQINGNNVLRVYKTASTSSGSNLYLGRNAGQNSNPPYHPNAFLGNFAGYNTTTGGGNTAVGYRAGYNNATGVFNTYIGYEAGGTGDDCQPAHPSPGVGNQNTFAGYQAGCKNGKGKSNTFLGFSAGSDNTEGDQNVYIGRYAGYRHEKGSNNIYLSNDGAGAADESGTIRIGQSPNQTAAYIAGISGATTASGVPVYIDGYGKLGTSGGVALVTSFNGRVGAVMPASGDYPPALLGTGTTDKDHFLSGAGTWLIPPGGGGGGNYINNGTALQDADFNIDGTGKAQYFDATDSYRIGGTRFLATSSLFEYQDGVCLGRDASCQPGASIYIGYKAGSNAGSPNNIMIGSQGKPEDQYTIRIGNDQNTAAYISGIYNGRVSYSASPVYVDSNGKLGAILGSSQEDVIKTQQQQIADLQQRVARLEALIEKK